MDFAPKPDDKIGQTEGKFKVGKLESPTESCISRAERIFMERSKRDTNPVIVQMVRDGKPIEHWYYRSDNGLISLFWC